jgi:hypothetical protein
MTKFILLTLRKPMKNIGQQNKRTASENRVKQSLPEWISKFSPKLSIRNLPPNGMLQIKTLEMMNFERSNNRALTLLQQDSINKLAARVTANTPKKIRRDKHSASPYARR